MPKPDHNHKQCMALFARMSEYLDNELDAATVRTIRKHLDNCRPCQVCLDTLKRTVLLCRSAGDVPIPDRLVKRLRDLIASNK